MGTQVTEKVNELSGDIGGTQAFLKHYQPGLVHIVKGLSKSEHAKMQSLATEWEERGAPVDVQRQYVAFLIYLYLYLLFYNELQECREVWNKVPQQCSKNSVQAVWHACLSAPLSLQYKRRTDGVLVRLS
jgi:hypothetical protein